MQIYQCIFYLLKKMSKFQFYFVEVLLDGDFLFIIYVNIFDDIFLLYECLRFKYYLVFCLLNSYFV